MAGIGAIIAAIRLTVDSFRSSDCTVAIRMDTKGQAVLRVGLVSAAILMHFMIAVCLSVLVDVIVGHNSLRSSRRVTKANP